MKFSKFVMLIVLLLATSVWSIKFSTTDLERIDIYYKSLQIGYAYTDVLGSNDTLLPPVLKLMCNPKTKMTAISVPQTIRTSGTPGDGGGQCAPDDLVCLGGGTGGGDGGTGGGGQCAPDDLVCLGGRR